MARDYPESVATTWLLSFQRVEAANPLAVELLQLCTFLAPDAIPVGDKETERTAACASGY